MFNPDVERKAFNLKVEIAAFNANAGSGDLRALRYERILDPLPDVELRFNVHFGREACGRG